MHLKKKSKKLIRKNLKFCKENKEIFLILLLSSFLIFSGISNRELWRDEANTALNSRNVFNKGLPKVFDGKNLVGTLDSDFNEDFISTKPPLMYYLVAISYFFFGVNTFAARFPFAISGVLCIFVTYLFALKLTKNKKIAILSSLLLAISVFFIVHSRNARYYSLSAFFSILTTYFYLEFLENPKNKFKLIFSSSLLFYAQPIAFFGLVLGLISHYFLILKNRIFKKENIKNLIFVVVSVGFLIFPWILYFYIKPPLDTELFSFVEGVLFKKVFLGDIKRYFVMLFQISPKILFLFIPFFIFSGFSDSIKKEKNKLYLDNKFLLILLLIFFNLFLVSFFDPGFGPQPRYIVGFTPFVFVFCGISINKISKISEIPITLIMFLLFFSAPVLAMFSNNLEDDWGGEYGDINKNSVENNPVWFNFIEEFTVHSKFPKYLYAIAREHETKFQDGTKEVSEYLLENGNKEDTIYSTNYALVRNLMFTTDMQVFPFAPGRGRYKKLFPNTTPDFILGGADGNINNKWEEYANENCEKNIIKIHTPFRAWDANRPAWGIESYYFDPTVIDFLIYIC